MRGHTGRRIVGTGTVALLIAALTVVASTTAAPVRPAAAAGPNPSMRYVPLAAPCRAVNTVAGSGPIAAGSVRSFAVGGSTPVAGQGGTAGGCGVPIGAGAAEVSITAVNPTGNGFLRAASAGQPLPNATFLNFTAGRSITNAGTVPIAAGVVGGIGVVDLAIGVFGSATNVVVDVQGYFITVDVPTTGSTGYVPLQVPCRVVNTIGTTAGRLGSGAAGLRNVQIAGSGTNLPLQGGPAGGCGVPTDAVAAELVITVVAPAGNGFLRAGPNTGAPPQSTLLNYTDGTTITNAGAVGLNPGQALGLTLANFGTSTDVLIDVLGYFSTSSGTTYRTVSPCRIANTGTVGTKLGPGGGRAWRIGGTFEGRFPAQGAATFEGCAVPQRAAAVEMAVSAVAPEGTGQVRISPMGQDRATTFLTYTQNRSVTNSGKLTLALAGTEDLVVRNNAATSGFVADVFGYFEPFPTTPLAPEVIDAGGFTTCALTGTEVRCWGAGPNGELGDGTLRSRPFPAKVVGTEEATLLTVGDQHACFKNSVRGLVKCWGDNTDGQLGDGTTVDRVFPVSITQTDLQQVVDISAGRRHTCAVRADRTVACWGANADGQLGDGTLNPRLRSVRVLGINDAVQVGAGGRHSCALRATGRVMCWGFNQLGRLGDGTIIQRSTPVEVQGITDAVSISVGEAHSCAVLNDGGIRCWGSNVSAQIGVGTSGGFAPVPGQPTGLTGVAVVSAGSAHTCALLLDGSSRCWGSGSSKQLGDGRTSTVTTPQVVPTLSRATLLSAGGAHTCAVRAGVVQTNCWGANASGQSGAFNPADVAFPADVPLMNELGSVATGGDHTCLVRAAGTVQCTGVNTSGQLGDGTTNSHDVLFDVVGLTGATAVVAGGQHTCALLLDTSVRCWGDNSQGQLGDSTNTQRSTPVRVSNLSGIVALAAGTNHTCALQSVGLSTAAVLCWGDNSSGQLGNGTTADSNFPVTAPNLKGTLAITAGANHSCAARGSQGVSCWGANASGQLGNSSTTPSSSPVAVTGLTAVVAGTAQSLGVTAGATHTCALLSDSTVRCWGENGSGQLNDGSTTDRSAPVTPGSTTGIVALSAGAAHTCAVRTNGTVICFGVNSAGQLGLSAITITPTVVNPVANLTTIVAIASGPDHSCAVRANSGVRCWGDNTAGQAGTGTSGILAPPGTGLGRP